jgi:hypothetical protein
MCILYLLTAFLTGGVSADRLHRWLNKRRPRADVHLKVRRGQRPDEIVGGMVQALSEIDDGVIWRDRRILLLESQNEGLERDKELLITQLDKALRRLEECKRKRLTGG